MAYSTPMPSPNSMPWPLVIAACIGLFAATATGSTRAPFLTDIAVDLNVSLPAIANLFGLTAAVWGLSSYFVGFVSDRTGRRWFLIASPALLACAMAIISVVQTYVALVSLIVFAAICCGSHFNAIARPSLLAALAEVPPEVRGLVMGLNSSVASIGWLTAALVGGWFYIGVGFGGFGPLMATMCLLGALIVLPDSRARLR